MPRIDLLSHAHLWIGRHLGPGDIAVDATVGNGHDTEFLARCVTESGMVYGFDIQPQAITQAQSRLKQVQLSQRCVLISADHRNWPDHLPIAHYGRIKAVMFNLGYLPGSDKQIITRSESTLDALSASLETLTEQGIISLMAYPGHCGGLEETQQVMAWLDRLDTGVYAIEQIKLPQRPNAPIWFGVQKLHQDK